MRVAPAAEWLQLQHHRGPRDQALGFGSFQQGWSCRSHNQQVDLGELGDEVVDEGQRLVIGPVKVLEKDDDRPIRRQRLEVAEQVGTGSRCQLPRPEQALHGCARPEVEAEPVTDELCLACGQRRTEADAHLVRDHRGRVAVEHAEPIAEEIAHEAERRRSVSRQRATLEEIRAGGMQVDPVLELIEQPRLADSGITDDRHRSCRRLVDHGLELGPQHAELVGPADHPRLDTFNTARGHAKRAGLRSAHHVHADRLLLALHRRRIELLDVEHAADVAVGVVRDEHAAERREALHPARHVHRVAHRSELSARANRAEVCRSRVDPDPHREPVDGAAAHHLFLHRQTGANGALRIVLLRRAHPPNRHDRVTDVLVDASAVIGDDRVEAGPQLVHHAGHGLGIQSRRHRREAAHVGEHHRHLAAPLRLRAGNLELSAQCRNRRVDDLVRDDASQTLLRRDRSFQLLPIGRRAVVH